MGVVISKSQGSGGTKSQISGGVSEQLVQDYTVREILALVLAELRKMNLHLEAITDIQITNEDVEEDDAN